MKKLILISLLIISLGIKAQTIVPHVTEFERNNDMLNSLPRQRLSTTNALVLTENWQTVAFVAGSSDVNTFPQARWDYVNNKILTNPNISVEQGYTIRYDMVLQNVTGMSKVQLRFVIPAPAPTYFPLPNSPVTSFVDLRTLTIQSETNNVTFSYDLYTNADFRAYGCQIQLRALSYSNTSNVLTGLISQVSQILTSSNRVQVTNQILNIYSK